MPQRRKADERVTDLCLGFVGMVGAIEAVAATPAHKIWRAESSIACYQQEMAAGDRRHATLIPEEQAKLHAARQEAPFNMDMLFYGTVALLSGASLVARFVRNTDLYRRHRAQARPTLPGPR